MSKINNLLDEIRDIIVFEISNTDYCTFIKDVTAIINPVTKLQGNNYNSDVTPVLFEGLEIPVFNLSKVMSNRYDSINSHSRIFIIEIGGQKYGFLVNRIKEIISFDKNYSNINLNFIKKNTENKNFCSGILDFEGNKYKMLDCKKIIEYYFEKNLIKI